LTVARENALPGTTDWLISRPAPRDETCWCAPALDAYAWPPSAAPGDTVSLAVSTQSSSFSADLFRMGWYQGLGGRLVKTLGAFPGRHG